MLTNPGRTGWSVAIDPAAPETAYAVLGYSPDVLVGTSNGGLTWSTLDLPETSHAQAVTMTAASHVLYVGTDGKLWSTSNAGQSWFRNGPGAGDVRKVLLVPSQSAIILGTDQGLLKTITTAATG